MNEFDYVFSHTDEDGDKLLLQEDNTLSVWESIEDTENFVDLDKEAIAPLIYHLINNLNIEEGEDEIDNLLVQIRDKSRQIVSAQTIRKATTDRLLPLAVKLHSAATGVDVRVSQTFLERDSQLRDKFLRAASAADEFYGKEDEDSEEEKRSLSYDDRYVPNRGVTWKANNDKGYFAFRLGHWHYSEDLEDVWRAYPHVNFSYLNEDYFPMTEV